MATSSANTVTLYSREWVDFSVSLRKATMRCHASASWQRRFFVHIRAAWRRVVDLRLVAPNDRRAHADAINESSPLGSIATAYRLFVLNWIANGYWKDERLPHTARSSAAARKAASAPLQPSALTFCDLLFYTSMRTIATEALCHVKIQ